MPLSFGATIQALVALGLRRSRRSEAVRVRAVLVGAASCASLFLLSLWAALRGQSLVAPAARASIVIWAMVSVHVLGWSAIRSRDHARPVAWNGRMTADQFFRY